jgi:hypothetical protein
LRGRPAKRYTTIREFGAIGNGLCYALGVAAARRRPTRCIIDREDIVAAAKFLICCADVVPLYNDDLMNTFAEHHYALGADLDGHLAVVLTPHPRPAEISGRCG